MTSSQAAAAATQVPRPDAAPPVVVTAPAAGLALEPGRHVVARVVEIDTATGGARISLAGQTISVQSAVPLAAGDTLSLTVGATTNGRVALTLDGSGGQSTPASTAAGSIAAAAQVAGGAQGSGSAASLPPLTNPLAVAGPASVASLAREGLPVSPQLAQAVTAVVSAIAGEAGAEGIAAVATQVAALTSRGLPADAALAARIGSALDASGSLGSQLASLAELAPGVAAALPNGVPTAAALRGLLTPDLTPAELAVARVVQASVAAASAGGVVAGAQATVGTPAVASPTVLANYVASQVAHATGLPTSAEALGVNVATAPDLANELDTPVTGATAGAGQAAADLVDEQAAAATTAARAGAGAGGSGSTGSGPGGGNATAFAGQALAGDAELLATTDRAAAQAVRSGATGAAASGSTSSAAAASSAAAGEATTPEVAQVVADLSTLLGRLAPTTSAVPLDAARAGATNPEAATRNVGTLQVNGGDAAALVVTLREALTDGGGSGSGAGQSSLAQQQQAQSQRVATALAGQDPAVVQQALRSMPEADALRVAGALLQAGGAALDALPPDQQAALKAGMHAQLEHLGRALAQGAHDETATLRAALHQVAAHDARPEVAAQARQLLDAGDGAQLLSAPRLTSADPGYVYFQVPLPGQGSAEVLVRREAGRRAVSFDNFDIAFLLNTQSLGSLLIHLDAHPAAVSAKITTDQPQLEPMLAAGADTLREAIAAEARRPVFVHTGVFSSGAAPTSLLEPALGLLPGDNSYYA